MTTLLSLDHLLKRVQGQIAEKKKRAPKEHQEANRKAESIYNRPELWKPVCIHRWYEVQTCDCCKGEKVLFDGDKVELAHTKDASAKRWLRERGEAINGDLPIEVHIIERVVPQCWDCHTIGKQLDNIFMAASLKAKLDKFLSKGGEDGVHKPT